MRLRPLLPALLISLALLLSACERTDDPSVLLQPLRVTERDTEWIACDPDPDTEQLVAVQIVRGVVAGDARFELYAPEGWRDLVEYAHGFVSPNAAENFDFDSPLYRQRYRDPLVCPAPGKAPLAMAVTDFGTRGLAVAESARRSRQVGRLFVSEFGPPQRTYAAGNSLGGAITLWNAERFPAHYDGAMPMCGFLAGTVREAGYVADVRTVFEVLYPGVIPGGTFDVPEGLTFAQVVGSVIGTIQAEAAANPTSALTKALALASIEQIRLPLRGVGPSGITNPSDVVASMIESLLGPLFFHVEGTPALLEATHGRLPVGNADTVYRASSTPLLPPPALQPLLDRVNATAERYRASPDASNYLERAFTPTGDLAIPTVTLHTTLDPAVPFFHEVEYGALAAAAGSSDLLVQLPVETFGHCNFTPDQVADAMAGLMEWVESGAHPW